VVQFTTLDLIALGLRHAFAHRGCGGGRRGVAARLRKEEMGSMIDALKGAAFIATPWAFAMPSLIMDVVAVGGVSADVETIRV